MFAPTPHRALGGALFDATSAAHLGGLTLSPPVRSTGAPESGADLFVSPAAATCQSHDSPAIAPAPALAAAPAAEQLAWRKILWEAQPFEDNHTPDSFLSSAVLNANVQTHTFTSMYARARWANQCVTCTLFPDL